MGLDPPSDDNDASGAIPRFRRPDRGAADFDYWRRPHCADTQRVMQLHF